MRCQNAINAIGFKLNVLYKLTKLKLLTAEFNSFFDNAANESFFLNDKFAANTTIHEPDELDELDKLDTPNPEPDDIPAANAFTPFGANPKPDEFKSAANP